MKKNRNRKRKFTKRKTIVIIILIAILVGILFLVNNLIPIKNINDDNISLNLSTINPTGKNIIANVSTKTNYDIFYYIDYSAGEEQYYENEELSEEIEEISSNLNDSNTSNTNNMYTSNSTNTINNSINNNSVNNSISSTEKEEKKLDIKQISNKEYKKIENSKFEIENNGIVYLKYGRLGKLSNTPYVFEISNIDKEGPEIGDIQTSTTATSITVSVDAIDKNQSNLQYYFRLSNTSSYISTGLTNSYTFNNLTTDDNYIINIKVADKFGNESEAVTEATASSQTEEDEDENSIEKKVYHFKVNLGANTVTVYDKDENGKYTNPIKAFVCSTGKATPKSGTYKISIRYRWRSLFGGVYGQYAVRIYGNILFHSVPYKQMYPNTLEYDEYDKLGTSASAGCIRLSVKDAKWIYDNAKNGSTVEFYSNSSNPGPLGKPTSQKISSNKANRNWDPTDPDEHNPWNGGDGQVTKTKIIDDNEDYENNDYYNVVKNNNKNNNTTTIPTNSNNKINNNTVSNTVTNTSVETPDITNNTDFEELPIIPENTNQNTTSNNTTLPNESEPSPQEPVENTTVTPLPDETTNTTVSTENQNSDTPEPPPPVSEDIPIIPEN